MSRGQQGIGISAAGMYGQLTTGKPTRIISRTGPRKKAHHCELQIDTRKNEPQHRAARAKRDWDAAARHARRDRAGGAATRAGGSRWTSTSQQIAIANPHADDRYFEPPDGEPRAPRARRERSCRRSRARSSRTRTASSWAC